MSDRFAHLKPFPVDPEVRARIRRMAPSDVSAVAGLHHASMGRSLWARLGLPFLEALYRELLHQESFVAYVYDDGSVGGFLAGSTDSQGLFLRTLWKGWRRLLPPLARGLLRDPAVLAPLLATPFYFARSHPGDDVPAESLFCSFAPELRGTRISGLVNKVFFDHLLAAGQPRVKITTEVDNPGSNRQLQSWGFEERGRFRFYGKQMITYVLELRGHPRLDPIGTGPGSVLPS